MKLAFYIRKFQLDQKDYLLTRGNPGIGGTEYAMLLLAYHMKNNTNHEVLILSPSIGDFIGLEKISFAEEIHSAIRKAKKSDIDLFIFAPENDKSIYELIDSLELNCATIMQNRFTYKIATFISNCKHIKYNVCPTREQYDCLIDHKIINKSVIIKNIINIDESSNYSGTNSKIITYMGQLTFQRGFHILASQWNKIIKCVPDAQLYVIGSANLYGDIVEYGSLGIASKEYENLFLRYLTDNNNCLTNSVHFMGKLGDEKNEIFLKTKVGIVNPLTREMGPLSALEMQMYGVPIVTLNRFGQLEAVQNNKTGLLFNNRKNMWKKIVAILTNDNLQKQLSDNAKLYVSNNHSYLPIVEKWSSILLSDFKITPYTKFTNYFNQYKILRVVNSKIKKLPFLSKLPSILFYEDLFKKIITRR